MPVVYDPVYVSGNPRYAAVYSAVSADPVVVDVSAAETSAIVTYTGTATQYRLNGGAAVSIDASPATITGLTVNTEYSIELRNGSDPWSAPYAFGTENPGSGGGEIPSAATLSIVGTGSYSVRTLLSLVGTGLYSVEAAPGLLSLVGTGSYSVRTLLQLSGAGSFSVEDPGLFVYLVGNGSYGVRTILSLVGSGSYSVQTDNVYENSRFTRIAIGPQPGLPSYFLLNEEYREPTEFYVPLPFNAIDDVAFRYDLDLGANEVPVTAQVTASVHKGFDSNPQAIVSGPAGILLSRQVVAQRIQPKFPGVQYALNCRIVLSSGRVLSKTVILPVDV